MSSGAVQAIIKIKTSLGETLYVAPDESMSLDRHCLEWFESMDAAVAFLAGWQRPVGIIEITIESYP